ncbi:acetyl-CoA carboxylase carboxyltransferase subunit alpha [endosymbiont 'TC1' of Trimyema compressum]|uniref:acetyl-CoA carboxylase carboxyltransferase subunit alpha n=1 Tax=endosymbiont 'TC1' of Trimyema compressum TaxID=243899 RepID=UPI000A902479|nr:acetyl-CoA carboxylase carboxyltransferase subunit alpha [endosymbiont 'TC1' of Trimyema compressum]
MTIKEKESQIESLKLKVQELELMEVNEAVDFSTEIDEMRKKITVLEENIMEGVTPWDRVTIAREQKRPTSLEYIDKIFDTFIEFHGDRLFADDKAIVGGIASLDGLPVTVIGEQKGLNTKDNIHRNFGMPSPEGYRKALRLMKQSEKFNRPIITFVDTPGAFCGISAEERGQGEAIARNLYEMSALKVPIITIFTGEGGSGGALAIAVSDKIYMLENSIYSILSPEGFASILWKDSTRAEEAAGVMKITAADLKELDIIEGVIAEPSGGAHKNMEVVAIGIKNVLKKELLSLQKLSKDALLDNRYKRFRKFGDYKE